MGARPLLATHTRSQSGPQLQQSTKSRGIRHSSRCHPLSYSFVFCGGILCVDLFPSSIRNQKDEDGQNAASKWQRTPDQALPSWRSLRHVHGGGRWYTIFGPYRNGFVVQIIDRAPTCKLKERIIVRVVGKDPLQAVLVCVLHDGSQGFETRRAKVLCLG